MIVAVDFDGTLTQSSPLDVPLQPPYPPTPPLRQETVAACRAWKKLGWTLVLWTSREGEGLEEAVQMCRDVGLEFDYVNESPAGGWPKIKADVYLDDRAVKDPEDVQRWAMLESVHKQAGQKK